MDDDTITFGGKSVIIPVGLWERLTVAADNHAARLVRHVDERLPAGQRIIRWLNDLEQARTMPTPHAEAGDLLVKVGRAEFWTFTVHGWRELAPIELAVDEGRRQTVEFVHEAADRDFLVGPSEAVRAGWGEMTSEQVATDEPHSVAYEMRYRPFGRSVVEDELDRLRNSGSSKTGWPSAIAEALDELLQLENAFDTVSGAAERCDLGVDERLTAFRDGIDHARVTLLDVATRHLPKDAA